MNVCLFVQTFVFFINVFNITDSYHSQKFSLIRERHLCVCVHACVWTYICNLVCFQMCVGILCMYRYVCMCACVLVIKRMYTWYNKNCVRRKRIIYSQLNEPVKAMHVPVKIWFKIPRLSSFNIVSIFQLALVYKKKIRAVNRQQSVFWRQNLHISKDAIKFSKEISRDLKGSD